MAGKKILLVEGTDDEHVFKNLCGQRNVGTLDEIKPQGSVKQLLENFPVRLLESEIEVLGVVLDADTDLAGRWDALKQRLIRAGYSGVPGQPAPEGTILDPPINTLLPRFGVWIMPDNRTTGILEDFLHFLVPAGSRLFEHVKSSVQAIPDQERRFSKLAEPKAIIHTWLAWQVEPGKPFGTAISAKFLDPNVSQVDVLVAWLKRLFFP
ncbi:MAG: DUF3226 domain-containing protein [Verrucomicrobiota bacterium]|jgi:hypothetical protein